MEQFNYEGDCRDIREKGGQIISFFLTCYRSMNGSASVEI
jgi:hypothetical protein